MAAEEFCLRALAHGVKAEEDLLQKLCRVQLVSVRIIPLILLLNKVIEVRKDGVSLRLQAAEVSGIADAPLFIQAANHNLNGINVPVAEIFVGAEKVLEEGDVLTQPCGLAERFGSVGVLRIAALVPTLRFQRIDAVYTPHQIHEAAADPLAHILLFMLHIQRYDRFARLQKIEQKQLEQIAFALAGVAQNQNAGGGFVVIPLIEVHQDIGAILILADIKAMGICLAAVVEWIQVSHRAGRQNPLKLLPEAVPTGRHDRNKPLPLTEEQTIHIELAPHQLSQHIGLQKFQGFIAGCGQLEKYGTVEKRFTVSVHGRDEIDHVLQIGLSSNRLLEILGAGAGHTVLVGCIVNDSFFLAGGNLPGIDSDGHAVHLSQVTEDSLLIGRGGVFPECPDTTAGVSAEEVIDLEVNDGRGNHIEEVFDIARVCRGCRTSFLSGFVHWIPPVCGRGRDPVPPYGRPGDYSHGQLTFL